MAGWRLPLSPLARHATTHTDTGTGILTSGGAGSGVLARVRQPSSTKGKAKTRQNKYTERTKKEKTVKDETRRQRKKGFGCRRTSGGEIKRKKGIGHRAKVRTHSSSTATINYKNNNGREVKARRNNGTSGGGGGVCR